MNVKRAKFHLLTSFCAQKRQKTPIFNAFLASFSAFCVRLFFCF
ncbi:hypothetical protein BGS_1011 [Beggiatoa sp. SS]|nr:hypothetical protein BGS_1011 [Beggiatoa sp. SS]